MIYFPETAYAPAIKAFQATIKYFFKIKHNEFIEFAFKAAQNEYPETTKQQLYSQHPEPVLDIIPITGDEEMEVFLERYSVLKKYVSGLFVRTMNLTLRRYFPI